jgi:TadE-like protein
VPPNSGHAISVSSRTCPGGYRFPFPLCAWIAGCPWRKSPESGTTGETACPTTKDQRFTKLVGQGFILSELLPRAADVLCARVFPMSGKRGAAMVEFALMALALYILIFGGLELGRMIFVAQALQDAARIAARELSVTPLPAGYTFDCQDPNPHPNTCDSPNNYVLGDATVVANIWNPNLLVIDISTCYNTDGKLNTYLNSLPLVNRALRPAFISETLNPGQPNERRLLRYPGALLPDPITKTQNCPDTYQDWGMTSNPSDLTVVVYQLNADSTVTQIPVLAEVRSNPNDPTCAPYGPFSFNVPTTARPAACGSDTPAGSRGIAAVAVNYPFQSAALSGFRSGGFTNGEPNPNMGNIIVSDDPAGTPAGTYTGPTGLGNQYAFAKTVRPYRNMLLGQAIFRREVTQ